MTNHTINNNNNTTTSNNHNHISDGYIILRVCNQIMCIPEEFVMNSHPGGSEIIIHYNRQNASSLFHIANHSIYALKQMNNYIIWDLNQFRNK